MPVMVDIFLWSSSRPMWQKDALRRLAVNGSLTDHDVEELLCICRTQRGLGDQRTPAPEPVPLTAAHLPPSGGVAERVCLTGVRDIQNVNALAAGQRLVFQPEGMSVVFGYNASGKSGYARILRRVCRARCRDTRILPNVFGDAGPGTAIATVDYRVGGAGRQAVWQEGQEPPAELRQVSFFDATCATVHVDDANELAFSPFGLDVLPRLASACLQMKEVLDRERAELEAERPPSLREPAAPAGTQVRMRLDALSADSDPEDFRALGHLTDQEAQRITEIRRALGGDPASTARNLRVRRERIEYLRQRMASIEGAMTDEQIQHVRGLLTDYHTKEEAARLAASHAFTDLTLPNVGGRVWRALWEAARRYSQVAAYPTQPFPFTGEGSRCVLCQQPLDAEAAARLNRFEEFVRGEARRLAEEAKQSLTRTLRAIVDLAISFRGHRDALQDVALENEALADDVRQFLLVSRLRRWSLLRSCSSGEWTEPSPLGPPPKEALESLVGQMAAQADRLARAAQSAERAKLEAELRELEGRQWLSSVIGDVTQQIAKLKRLRAIDRAIGDTVTTGITRKSSELTNAYVTVVLQRRFAEEVQRLGAQHLRIAFQSAGGQYGQTRFQVHLQGAAEADVQAVLSEGEHRCIALAGFLAELSTEASRSALVFDDPVSSLDHQWRRLVAKRLVEEAALRQVVVFTHDVVFLLDLIEMCDEAGVALAQSYLYRENQAAGICTEGVPWVSMPVSARIRWLRDQLRHARAVHRRDGSHVYEPLARNIYGLLREAWERGVEEVLLNGAVVRFGRAVQTQRLRRITDIEDADVEAVDAGMAKASRFLVGHDQPAAICEPVPPPDELEADIEALSSWVEVIRRRR